MASVTSLSDEDLTLLYDLNTTCFTDGYTCHLPAEDVTVTAPDQLLFFWDKISYSDLSPESAAGFKVHKEHCDACTVDGYGYHCDLCHAGYIGADHYSVFKDGKLLFLDINLIYYHEVKEEYEARGLNTSTEEIDNSLTNIIQSKLDLGDITYALLYVCMILIAFLISDYLSDLVVRFFYSAHDETEYPDDYCSDEDWQEYLEEKAFCDNR